MDGSDTSDIVYFLPVLIPLFFAVMWLGVTSLLAALSGWFVLMQQYPDRDEKPLLQLNWQSGFMGQIPVNFRHVLKLGLCQSGLRIGVVRILGVFSRDFFVPWREIKATRRKYFMWDVTELDIGMGVGRLLIYQSTADKLIQAAHDRAEIEKALKGAPPK